MRIAVTSQDFRSVTPHAGRAQRILIYESGPYGEVIEVDRLELPRPLSLCIGAEPGDHPLLDVDVLITGSLGPGFGVRLAAGGILAVATTHTDALDAVRAFFEAGGPPAFVEHAGSTARAWPIEHRHRLDDVW